MMTTKVEEFPPISNGDVLSALTDSSTMKFGIYIDNGYVIFVRMYPHSNIGKIVCEKLNIFSEGHGVNIENLYMLNSKYSSYIRCERAKSAFGKRWGNKYDLDPMQSFVRYICEDIPPPNMKEYKFTIGGGIIGFYFGGALGVMLGSGIGMIIDHTKRYL